VKIYIPYVMAFLQQKIPPRSTWKIGYLGPGRN